MITATNTKSKTYRTTENIQEKVFTIPSVALSSVSDVVQFDLGCLSGKLLKLAISCASTNYDVSIRAINPITLPSIDEIIKIENIGQAYAEERVSNFYSNNDAVPTTNLYGVITNNDAVNATGTITIRFIFQSL